MMQKVWISQPNALVDKREMVEIKHELLSRRQRKSGHPLNITWM